jgi:hypothetical protein
MEQFHIAALAIIADLTLQSILNFSISSNDLISFEPPLLIIII